MHYPEADGVIWGFRGTRGGAWMEPEEEMGGTPRSRTWAWEAATWGFPSAL